MTDRAPGAEAAAEVSYTVTWLEMRARPERPRPPVPALKGLSLLRVETPPVHFFRYLYDVVGRDYEWTDLHRWSDDDLAAFAQDPKVALSVAYVTGWPAGFIQLDYRTEGVCDIAYFGLAPEMIGRGLGAWLLGTAIHTAWDRGVAKMTVNTCTLDHPRALSTDQRWGFVPVEREERRRRVAIRR